MTKNNFLQRFLLNYDENSNKDEKVQINLKKEKEKKKHLL